MKVIVVALKSLQSVDTDVRSLAAERDVLSSRLDQLVALHQRGTAELEEKRAKLADVESFYRDKNSQLKADLDKASRAKAKLSAVKNTREHQAARNEMEALQRSNAQQEEEIIKLLEAVEGYKSGIAEDEKRLNTLAKELEKSRKENAGQIDALTAKITAIESKKAKVCESLPKGLLRKYLRTLEARDGVAVVEVIDGTCLGCNIQIPPQKYIELMRMESLMNCPNCQRFIFVDMPGDEDETHDLQVAN